MAEKSIVSKEVTKEVDQVKTFSTNIIDTYEDNVVVIIDGWRMGVYLDLPSKEMKTYKEVKDSFKGRTIDVSYIGDLNDVHTLKLLPLKTLVK